MIVRKQRGRGEGMKSFQKLLLRNKRAAALRNGGASATYTNVFLGTPLYLSLTTHFQHTRKRNTEAAARSSTQQPRSTNTPTAAHVRTAIDGDM